MKRLMVFATQKGGAGKTTLAKATLDLCRKAGRTVSAWDLDASTSSFSMVYPERNPVRGVALDDVRDAKSDSPWLDALFTDADDVLLDVPGGAMDDLIRVLRRPEALVRRATEAGRELVLVTPIGVEPEAVLPAQDAVERFGGSVRHMIPKNGYFGDPDEFVVFDGMQDPDTNERLYGTTGDVVREAGGSAVYVPKLELPTMLIVKLRGFTFIEAAERYDRLGRRHSYRVADWLEQVEEAFEGTWLAPNGVTHEHGAARKERRARAAAAS